MLGSDAVIRKGFGSAVQNGRLVPRSYGEAMAGLVSAGPDDYEDDRGAVRAGREDQCAELTARSRR